MKRKILSLSLIIVSIFTMFSIAFAPKVQAATKYGYGFASKPVPVYADSSFSATYISQLQSAINAWNNAGAGTLLTYAGTRNNIPMLTYGIGVTKIAQNNQNVATTLTYDNGSSIVRATISLNSNYTFNNNGTSSGTYYLKSVFMHELGHALGLTDSSNSSSVMYYAYTGSTNITSGDVNDLRSIY